jgi:hypothetical protein
VEYEDALLRPVLLVLTELSSTGALFQCSVVRLPIRF